MTLVAQTTSISLRNTRRTKLRNVTSEYMYTSVGGLGIIASLTVNSDGLPSHWKNTGPCFLKMATTFDFYIGPSNFHIL